MQIVFLDKENLQLMPFKVEKTMTGENWEHLKNEATKKLGTKLAIIFWDNKKIFKFEDVTFDTIISELGIPKTQF